LPAGSPQRLVSPITLIGVVAILGGGLFALFRYGPRTQPSEEEPSELALSYLRRQVAANPGKPSDRLKLARMELAVGRVAEADVTLAPLLALHKPQGREARGLHLKAAVRQLAEEQANSAERAVGLARARQALEDVIAYDSLVATPADWDSYARQALALEQPGRAAELYQQLAERDPVRKVEWLRQAARWYEAVGKLERAAQVLDTASRVAPDREKAGELALAALAKIRALGPTAEKQAQEQARILRQRFPESTPVKAATQALIDELEAAEARPKGDEARLLALLGKSKIQPALQLLKRMVEDRPEDLSRRRWLGLVARWNDQPGLSLEQWFFLAGKGNKEGLQMALPLARALYDHKKVAALLVLKAGSERLTPDEIYELAERYETLGDPGRALAALEKYGGGLRGERRYWQERVALREAQEESERALDELVQMKQEVGLTVDDVVKGIELLWKHDQAAEAMAFAQENRAFVTENDLDFWRQYGDLAYAQGAWQEAKEAYTILIKTPNTKASPAVFEHLLQLLENENQVDEMAAVAMTGFQRHQRMDWLLAAMQKALDGKRWDLLSRLLDSAGKDEARASSIQKGYWQMRAAVVENQGQPEGGMDDNQARPAAAAAESTHEPEAPDQTLQRALGVGLNDQDIRLQLLQLAVEAKDQQLVRTRLDVWGKEFEKDPEAWETLSDAYELLGNHALSVQYARAHRKRTLDIDPASLNQRADRRRNRGGALLPADARLQMATEENDHRAMAAVLDEPDGAIAIDDRIEAEHTIGRNDRAWKSLLALAAEADKGGATSPSAQWLRTDLDDTRRTLLASRGGRIEAETSWLELGDLDILEGRARVDVPWTRLAGSLGLLGAFDLLRPFSELGAVASKTHESMLAATLHRDVVWGTTDLRAGMVMTEDKTTVAARGLQSLRWSQKGALLVGGWYHEPTLHSSILRRFGFESGASLAVHQEFTEHNRFELEVQGLRFGTHHDDLVAWGLLTHGSDAYEWQAGPLQISIRLDGEVLLTRRAHVVPRSLPVEAGDFDTLLPDRYAMVGPGLTLSNRGEELGSGVGRAWGWHYLLEGETGWLWPDNRPWAGVAGGLGIIMPRWQEILLRGHYYTSYGGMLGQRYAGVSLGYVLRWM
jgi:hypothetical protein